MLPKLSTHQFLTKSHYLRMSYCRISRSLAQLVLSKSKVLVDEKVQIKVNDLKHGQQITLQAYMNEGDKLFGSCGHFVADQSGCVDTFKDISYGGTYQGQDPMGLFCSMKTTPGVKRGRLIKTDVMSPYNVNLAVYDGVHDFDSLPWSNSSSSIASCQLQRSYAAPDVQRFSLAENGLFGTLFTPPGDGPFPAIINVSGLNNGIMEFMASLLASHGYASLAVGYVGLPGLPKNELELDLNYFLKMFDWLAVHPKVDSKNIGGFGNCVGAGYLQFIASMRPTLKCLVVINTPAMAIGREQTVEGEFIKLGQFHYDRITKVNGLISFRSMYSEGENIPVVPSWRHGAKMLAIQCLEDQCVNPCLIEKYRENIPDKYLDNFTLISYPEAGHLLEPPFAPMCEMSYNTIFNMHMLWGGKENEHCHAQEDSWLKILQFLKQNLNNS